MIQHENEHRTMTSYVVGFVLSLVLTFVTYYLVDNQTISGQSLLVTILGFGLLQMLVQIFFFLHLGRGPKPFYNVVFFGATFGAILVVVGGSIIIINNLHYNMPPTEQTKKLINDEAIYQINGEKTGACQGQHANHQVTIKDGQVIPLHTHAHKCDTLSIINKDSGTREIAFGAHPAHDSYAGLTELVIRKGISKTITLSETGSYKFHDHLQAATAGELTVEP